MSATLQCSFKISNIDPVPRPSDPSQEKASPNSNHRPYLGAFVDDSSGVKNNGQSVVSFACYSIKEIHSDIF